MTHDDSRCPPEIGTLIAGKYRIDGLLGRGAMGVVMAASQVVLGQKVAIKFLARSTTPAALARFLREARAMASVESEYVVRILDYGMLDDTIPFMVMQHLPGRDLAAELSLRGGSLPPSEAADLVIQACAGLSALHDLGIVHRDIKPRNIFVSPRRNGELALKILDLGISKIPKLEGGDDSLTHTDATVGSPLFMSPEQIRDPKHVSAQADLWSLGVVLRVLLSGRPPFVAQGTTGLLAAIIADAPIPLLSDAPGVPPLLEAVVARCLEKQPAFRYATARELASALTPFASRSGVRVAEELQLLPLTPALNTAVPGVLEPSFASASRATEYEGPSNVEGMAARGGPRTTLRVSLGILAIAGAVGVVRAVNPSRGPDRTSPVVPAVDQGHDATAAANPAAPLPSTSASATALAPPIREASLAQPSSHPMKPPATISPARRPPTAASAAPRDPLDSPR